MTCIVALESPRGVWVGCDSFFGNERWRDTMDRPKWTRHGRLLVATSGPMRFGQIAEAISLQGAKRKRGEDDIGFLLRAYIEPLRAALELLEMEPNEGLGGMTAILALGGRAYTMTSDLGIYRSGFGYCAIGSGDMAALGSLAASPGLPPRHRIMSALEASAAHTTVVTPPFHVAFVAR